MASENRKLWQAVKKKSADDYNSSLEGTELRDQLMGASKQTYPFRFDKDFGPKLDKLARLTKKPPKETDKKYAKYVKDLEKAEGDVKRVIKAYRQQITRSGDKCGDILLKGLIQIEKDLGFK